MHSISIYIKKNKSKAILSQPSEVRLLLIESKCHLWQKYIRAQKAPRFCESLHRASKKKNHICLVNFLHRGGARSLPHFYSRQTLRSTDAKVIEIGFSFQDRGIIVHYGISIKNSPNVISVSLFQPVLSKALAVKSFVRWKECVYSTDKKYWC